MQLINPRAIYPGVAGERLGVGEDGKTAWVEGNLDSLVDVDLTTTPPVDGDALVYDDTLEQWVPGAGSGGGSIATLTDVDLTGLADGDVLVYDLGSGMWIPAVPGAGYTDEQARDAIGAALAAGYGIDIVVSDGSDTITIASVVPPPFSIYGTLIAQAYTLRWYAPADFTVSSVRASVGTQPTGSSAVIDVLKNGTTLFTGGTDRPTIAAGTNTDTGTPAVTSVTAGDYLTVTVVSVGSTVPGAHLTVQIIPA